MVIVIVIIEEIIVVGWNGLIIKSSKMISSGHTLVLKVS